MSASRMAACLRKGSPHLTAVRKRSRYLPLAHCSLLGSSMCAALSLSLKIPGCLLFCNSLSIAFPFFILILSIYFVVFLFRHISPTLVAALLLFFFLFFFCICVIHTRARTQKTSYNNAKKVKTTTGQDQRKRRNKRKNEMPSSQNAKH